MKQRNKLFAVLAAFALLLTSCSGDGGSDGTTSNTSTSVPTSETSKTSDSTSVSTSESTNVSTSQPTSEPTSVPTSQSTSETPTSAPTTPHTSAVPTSNSISTGTPTTQPTSQPTSEHTSTPTSAPTSEVPSTSQSSSPTSTSIPTPTTSSSGSSQTSIPTSSSTSEQIIAHYTVTWDVNGSITTEDYIQGEIPVFKGNTSKASDAQYTYTFTGWSPEISAVTQDVTYVAQYSTSTNKYTVTWNVAGNVTTEEYNYGATPSFKGDTSKANDAQYTYEFNGWYPSIDVVTQNITYVAQYSNTVNHYTITWDVDGVTTTEDYAYGETPTFKGSTDKAGDAQYTHSFTGWSPEILPVTQDATYVAQYSSTVNHYTVTWNIDGNTTTEDYAYGDTPVYKDGTPTKLEDAQYSYSFEGWNPTISQVTGNATYEAVFSSSLEKAKIIFDLNGGTSSSSTSPIYKSSINSTGFFFDCVKEGWNFRGWSYNGVKVFDEKGIQLSNPPIADTMTFVAMYSQTVKVAITTNINDAGVISGQGEYAFNSNITVSAHPNQGYVFVGWYYQNILISPMQEYNHAVWDEDVTYEARFALDTFTMSIHSNDENYGSVKFSQNAEYSSNQQEDHDYTSQVTIAALTKTSVRFLGWYNSNNELVSTKAIYSFTMPNYDYTLVAKWNYFTVSYNLNGGTNSPFNVDSYTIEDEIITLYEPTKTGYDFMGWWYGDKYIAKIESNWIKNIELNAIWKAHDYSVTYELNGGTNNQNNPSSYSIEDSTIVLEQPTRLGYTFDGWYINSDFSDIGISQITHGSYGDITLYAKWTPVQYSISYNLDGGTNSLSNPSTYTIESSFTFDVPTKTGYTFLGWFDSNDNQVTSIVAGTTGALTLTAHWNEGNEYVVTLDPNGGSIAQTSINVQYDHSYSLPTPSRLGYTFGGWYENSAKISNSGTWKYLSNKDLVAHWEIINYSITYTLNGGTNSSSNPSTYTVEDNIVFASPTKTGYTFLGWFDNEDNQITSIEAGTTGALSLIAHWNEGNEYAVTLNPNGGSIAQTSVNVQYDHVYSLPTPTRLGYTFGGWYENSTKISNSGTWKYLSNKDLVAHWTIVKYSITYTLNGGTNNSSNPSTYTVEDSIVFASPTKTGYTFLGWFDSNDNQVTSITAGTTGALSLVAHWNEGNEYVVTLDPNGGSIAQTSINVQYDHSYSLPTPTRLGYTFDGWYESSTKISNSGTWKYVSDKGFVAHWTINNYSINYTLNGGTNNPSNPSSYTVEDTVTFADPTAPTGYSFAGWYVNGTVTTGIPVDSTGTVNIEARWSANLNNLSVTSEDTSKGTVAITSGSGYSGESITVVAAPVGDCVFKGWYHDDTKVSDDATYTFVMSTNDYSLVAHFFTKAEQQQEEELWNIAHGVIPTLSNDSKTITYGLYPQTNVNDSSLISALNALTMPESNGWYLYEGDYYAKVSAKPYDSNYIFDNGTKIVSGRTYWFKCEPITWNVLSNNDGEYYILSSVLLDAHCYYNLTSKRTIDGKTIYANNYEYSDIRAWLNNDFYNSAFALGNSHIQTTTVDNSASTTDSTSNKYACANTQDKVFLPSYEDYINSSYGFSTSISSTNTRYCKTTDWARARGACYYTSSLHSYNGEYWTRSPFSGTSDYSIGMSYVTTGGALNNYYVYHTYRSVRPALSIKIA